MYRELQAFLMPNEFSYICKQNLAIVTHTPNEDYESTLIYPSTNSIPNKICEQRMLTLEYTYCILLYLRNECLFTASTIEFYYCILWNR